ncbi:MAG TPA: ZIP family metal transporter [Candidatus Paceibacterota bacterium]
MTEALIAAAAIAAISLIGVLFFGHDKRLIGIERFVIPVAVGVFLSLVLYELIPETLEAAPGIGGIVVAIGFLSFYILSNILHKRFHHLEAEECDRKGAAMLLLIGDSIHNLADGFILGGAFLIDPAVGVATAIGLALHEIPQEIVEFGVLLRAGYTRKEAAVRNLISASSVIVGTLLILAVAEQADEYVWVFTGFAAGNLLFLAATDLLPRIHGNLKNYGSIWHSTVAVILGFVLMTAVVTWTHEQFGHGHEEQPTAVENDHHDELVAEDHPHELNEDGEIEPHTH